MNRKIIIALLLLVCGSFLLTPGRSEAVTSTKNEQLYQLAEQLISIDGILVNYPSSPLARKFRLAIARVLKKMGINREPTGRYATSSLAYLTPDPNTQNNPNTNNEPENNTSASDKYTEKDYDQPIKNSPAASQANDNGELGKFLKEAGITPEDVKNNSSAFKDALSTFSEDDTNQPTAAPADQQPNTVQPKTGEITPVNKDGVSLVPWNIIQKTLGRCSSKEECSSKVMTIQDVSTGKTFKAARASGSNHADTETITLEDTAAWLDIIQAYSWTPTPVIVTYKGNKYAAAMRRVDHAGLERVAGGAEGTANRALGVVGTSFKRSFNWDKGNPGTNYDYIKGNEMEGHFCLYFCGSTGHKASGFNADSIISAAFGAKCGTNLEQAR